MYLRTVQDAAGSGSYCSGDSSGLMTREAGGTAATALRSPFIASYAVGRVAGSGSTIDASTLSIAGMVLWDKKNYAGVGKRGESDVGGDGTLP